MDAVVIDKMPAGPSPPRTMALKVLDTAYTTEDYCAAVAKDNEALVKEVNVVLAELKADGTLDQNRRQVHQRELKIRKGRWPFERGRTFCSASGCGY